MTGRLRLGKKSSGPTTADSEVVVEIQTHWWPVKEPVVGLRFAHASGRGMSVFLTGDEARSLGARLLEAGDKVILTDQGIDKAKFHTGLRERTGRP